MNWTNESATESGLGRRYESDQGPESSSTTGPDTPREIKVGKTILLAEEHGKEVKTEVFTMTLGSETIQLLPFRNWGQLDIYKWTVRGKLPGTPAGLEITPDHAKLAGEMVSMKDPEGCAKLETLFGDWLALERNTLELTRKSLKRQQAPAVPPSAQPPEAQPIRFQVQVDKGGQVHINCLQGKEMVNSIGLNQPGFSSLISQGIMTKPRVLKVGVLHDWVELDGVLCSFEKGNNDAAKLEKLLNERYVPSVALGQGKEVVVFANPASSTGFDLQFPVTVGGVTEFRKRPLNEESLEILQDTTRCGLLQPGTIIKLARPNLIFKQKTPDGGEQYLPNSAANTVLFRDEDGNEKGIDLSRPVNCLRLGAPELTAIFNHPAVNRHSKASSASVSPNESKPTPMPREAQPEPLPDLPSVPGPGLAREIKLAAATPAMATEVKAGPPPAPINLTAVELGSPTEARSPTEAKAEPLPNNWLGPILCQPQIRHDWFTCLVYSKIAERIGNSAEGKLGPISCWGVALTELTDMSEPGYKGVFLTEKGGLGFINAGHMARFRNGVAFIGTLDSAIEGIDVTLRGVGMDAQGRMVFLVSDDYRSKFGITELTLAHELKILKEFGAALLSVKEASESREPVEILWTVPAQQEDPNDPQALETLKPEPL